MKYYKIYLSNKSDVIIDSEDYQKLLAGLQGGSFVKLKNAIVNPSFVSHVMPASAREALDAENPDRKIEGYLDEERGVFVVTKDVKNQVTGITDKFDAPKDPRVKEATKLLADKMRV